SRGVLCRADAARHVPVGTEERRARLLPERVRQAGLGGVRDHPARARSGPPPGVPVQGRAALNVGRLAARMGAGFLIALVVLVLWQNVLEALGNRGRSRGQMIDAGGHRVRMIISGTEHAGPTEILE